MLNRSQLKENKLEFFCIPDANNHNISSNDFLDPITILKERMKTLSEIQKKTSFYLQEVELYIAKKTKKVKT